MRQLIPALVRLAVLALAVTAYMTLVVPRWGDDGDANIGAGLAAFAGLIVISFAWSVLDARRHGFAAAFRRWVVVGVGIGLCWSIMLAFTEDGEAGTRAELVTAGLALAPFLAGLVVLPAILGAAIGSALRPGSDEAA